MNGEKIKQAIERLKAFEPADEPYYLCYSGGKDSDCIRILADLAGVKHDIVHNLTTVDAPETGGNKRIGCIGCPMQGGKGMKSHFIRYPKYRDNYLRAFKRMLKAREAAGLDNSVGWTTPEDVMMWWVGDNPLQMRFETPEYLKGVKK